MSSRSNLPALPAKPDFRLSLVNDYCSVATAGICRPILSGLSANPLTAIVLLLYDSFLTTRDEMRFFWGRKFTGATILFLINKWLCILLYGSILATFLKTSDAVRSPTICPFKCLTLPCLATRGKLARPPITQSYIHSSVAVGAC